MQARRFRLQYPPSTAVAVEDEMFIVGGGGGTSKSGIPNRISLLEDTGAELKEVAHVDFKLDRVVGLCSHPKNKIVLCTTAGGMTHTVSYSTTKKGEEYSPAQRAVAFSPSGSTIAISKGRSVTVWRSAKATGLVTLNTIPCEAQHKSDVRDLLFLPDGKSLVTLDEERCCLWTLDTLALRHSFTAAEDAKDVAAPKFRGVTLDSQESHLFTLVSHAARTGSAGFVTVRKITDEGLTVVKSAKVASQPATALGGVRGGRLSVATNEGEVLVVDAARLKPLCQLTLHALPVTKVLMLEDGDTFSVSLDAYCCVGLTAAEMTKLKWRERQIYAVLLLLLLLVFYLLLRSLS